VTTSTPTARREQWLAARNVTFLLASRSPLATLDAYNARMGWGIPWVSSDGLKVVWQLLDRTPRGREHGAVEGWPRRHDGYGGECD
jgi:predicted dithiol-disulfide oxidoreductase (DUF899 family)